MMSFNNIDRRLVLRYQNARAFSFDKVRTNSSDQALYGLANAFASVQSEKPNKITTVLVRQLV